MTPLNIEVPTPETDLAEKFVYGHIDYKWTTSEFSKSLERRLILAKQELAVLRKALQRISEYDDEPIWEDDRDDAANHMLVIARDALTKITP